MAGLELAELQQVVEQRQQMASAGFDHTQIFAVLRVEGGGVLCLQHGEERQQGRQRGAQLVAQICEQGISVLGGLFECLVGGAQLVDLAAARCQLGGQRFDWAIHIVWGGCHRLCVYKRR